MQKITDPAEPTLAIIITAYNYAHYLRACINSVLSQTRLADEVIVVDDGSTDPTPKILKEYSGLMRVLRVDNAGQASAFNLAFSESTSDLVLFLDADDTLLPHAVETILLNWSDDMAQLVFDLEIIDAEGASLGIHPGLRNGTADDNRPSLFGRAHLGSVPTSGNVFSRDMLNASLPIPQERWRISADCYLVRAAALYGRTGHANRVLGQYRLHHTNNYTRLGAGGWEEGLRLVNQLDAADALDDLAEASNALLGNDARKIRRALRKHADAIRTGTDGADAIPDDDTRHLLRSRYLPIMDFDIVYNLSDPASVGGGLVEGSGQIEFDLRLPSCTGPLSIDIRLNPLPEASVEFQLEDTTVARIGPNTPNVTLSLERRPFLPDRTLRITAISDGDTAPRLKEVVVSSERQFGSAPVVYDLPGQPAFRTLATGIDANHWISSSTGGLCLTGARGSLRFSAEHKGLSGLVLELSEDHPPGWVTISHDRRVHYQGRTDSAGKILVPMEIPDGRIVELNVEFSSFKEGNGTSPEPHFTVDFVRLKHLGASFNGKSSGSPLSVGQTIILPSHPFSRALLGDGWSGSEGESPITNSMEAKLQLLLPSDAQDVSLALEFSPIVQMPNGPTNIIGISRDGEMLASALLPTAGEIIVPIKSVPADGTIELSVHAVMPVNDQPNLALVGLHSISLEGRHPARAHADNEAVCIAPDFEILSVDIRAALKNLSNDNRAQELAAKRAAFVDFLAEADVSLHVLFAGNETRLSMLVDLHLATRFSKPSAAENAVLDRLLADKSEAAGLKAAIVALLLLPAYRHPFAGNLFNISPPFLAGPHAFGRYLGAPPTLLNESEHEAYRAYLNSLFNSAWRAISPGPRIGRYYPVAESAIRNLRAIATIFSGGNIKGLVRAQSRLIERLLSDQGAHLTMPRIARRGVKRLKVGVLVRDILETPESWVLQGIYSEVDQGRFELVLIRMENEGAPAPEYFESELCLAGVPLHASVQAIRDLNLDLFITGAYARDFEKVSSIYAYRLAPVQLWHATVCPTTGGFSSFDGVLSCQASEPLDAASQYFEMPIHWIEGPKQSAFALHPPRSANRVRGRAALGLAKDQVMFVSTAMAHKIGDELLQHWARILAQARSAILVLAPFAPNWSMPLDIDFFSERLRAAGLPEDRVVVSPPVPPANVFELLTTADVFLDSFPYCGATTVCEALSCGIPVVTCKGATLRQMTGTSWVVAYGLSELVASDPENYVEIATKLAMDPEFLADAKRRTKRASQTKPPPHNDQLAYGKIYSELLWRIAGQSGFFPELKTAEVKKFRPSRTPARSKPYGRRVEPQRLVILASPRTGSTMFCSILNRTPFTTYHFELFHREMIQFSSGTVTDKSALDARDADPLAFLEKTMDESRGPGTRLIGFKHFWHLGRDIDEAVVHDPRYLVVHLSRENLLAQHSSELLARSSGVWVQHDKRPEKQATVQFIESEFERFVQYQRRLEMERINAMSKARKAPLFVEYTSLNCVKTRKSISKFIGIRIPDLAQPDVAKQNSFDILSRFENQDDVRRYLEKGHLEHWQTEIHEP